MGTHEESLEFIKKISKIKEINAPYDFAEIEKAIVKAGTKAKIVKYFAFLNQPALCDACGRLGGEMITTVATTKPVKTMVFSLSESHQVEKHKGSFTSEQLNALKEIFKGCLNADV